MRMRLEEIVIGHIHWLDLQHEGMTVPIVVEVHSIANSGVISVMSIFGATLIVVKAEDLYQRDSRSGNSGDYRDSREREYPDSGEHGA